MQIKKNITKILIVVLYAVWCATELYLLSTGKNLSGYSGTVSIMEVRKKYHTLKRILEVLLVCVALTDIWWVEYKKHRDWKKIVVPMALDGCWMVVTAVLMVLCSYILQGSMAGYLNFFEPLWIVFRVFFISVIIAISFQIIRKRMR